MTALSAYDFVGESVIELYKNQNCFQIYISRIS